MPQQTFTLPEAIQKAQALYANGQYKEAENFCTVILTYVPDCQEAKDILSAVLGNIYDSNFYSSQADGSYRTAQVFLRYLFNSYKPNSVIDFGAGVGTWLRAAQELGVEHLHGLEGDWVQAQVSNLTGIDYTFYDLTQSYKVPQKWDLALSLEVAEHLPESRADSFVQDICDAADLVMFSAAMKHQGGPGHINEQNQSYWIHRFRIRNYECLDLFRRPFWFRNDLEPWYIQNTFLFIRKGDPRRDLFTNDPLYDVHHPRLLNDANRRLYLHSNPAPAP